MPLSATNKPELEPPVDLRLRALDNLSFIRGAMERASVFTAVPGWGMVGMGVLAIVGGSIAAQRWSVDWWINTWACVALAGCVLGTVSMAWKAQRQEQTMWSGLGRRAIFSFSPAILAGMVFTEVLYEHRLEALMPGVWLMLYGVAVCGAGAFSVRVVPLLGLSFMLLALPAFFIGPSGDALLGPMHLSDLLLVTGFGGFHILAGLYIARNHGG